MAYLLKTKFGFLENDIVILTDNQPLPHLWPTRMNMLYQLQVSPWVRVTVVLIVEDTGHMYKPAQAGFDKGRCCSEGVTEVLKTNSNAGEHVVLRTGRGNPC